MKIDDFTYKIGGTYSRAKIRLKVKMFVAQAGPLAFAGAAG